MSKRINVNPDHYKTAGRERPNVVAAARQAAAKPVSQKRSGRMSKPFDAERSQLGQQPAVERRRTLKDSGSRVEKKPSPTGKQRTGSSTRRAVRGAGAKPPTKRG